MNSGAIAELVYAWLIESNISTESLGSISAKDLLDFMEDVDNINERRNRFDGIT